MHIDVENISFNYRDKEVLKDVSFRGNTGDMVSLLGRNGSGKTTLLKLLLGFLEPKSGSIMLDGISLGLLTYKDRAKCIAYIPQYSNPVFPSTVLDSVVMGRASSMGIFSKPGKIDYEIAKGYMRLLGIEKLEKKSISRISGGEKQLAMIARALTQDAKTLILDEPLSALDYANQIMVLERIERLRSDGYSILFSTHNPEHALMASSVLILDNGKSEMYSPPSVLKDGQRLSKLYKRELFIEEIDTGRNRRLACLWK